ncbi:hypothetical protein DYU11_32200 [Fibrisoma montanum]|uniref:ABC transporter permease n=1 Tax=Fibrisoma montanum TaxID=2305895 RepID=A0A418LVN7_9BACT|nr:ABC transporter permease [Fibrisoma montanum]RIV17352.1 hypothetical protein DYU11_32200 [Fibrisoma montanum]
MLRNYVKIALRTLWKSRVYTTINLAGLAIAMAFCLLIYLYIRHEYSFDRFHAKADRIYRLDYIDNVNASMNWSTGFLSSLSPKDNKRLVRLPYPIAPAIKQQLPDVQNAVRFTESQALMRVGEQMASEKLYFVDQAFLDMFSFALVHGDRPSALREPNDVVLSKKLAEKYFGTSNPVGRAIKLDIDGMQPFTVRGVMDEIPSNSSLKPDMLVRIERNPAYNEYANTVDNCFCTTTMVEVKAGVDPVAFRRKLNVFANNYFKGMISDWKKNNRLPKDKPGLELKAKALADLHFDSAVYFPEVTNPLYASILVSIAVLMLFVACVNYVSLTLANAATRTQEVGVRKVVGAGKGQVWLQLWTETQLLTLGAFGLTYVLTAAFLPTFNQFTGRDLQLDWSDWWLVGGSAALVVIIGLLAGGYPALVLSGYRPIKLLRGNQTYRVNPVLSRSLVVVQYGICLFLMTAALVMNRQMRFVAQKDLGFDKEHVLVVNNYEKSPEKVQLLRERLTNLKLTNPDLVAVSGTSSSLGRGTNMYFYTINDEDTWVYTFGVDYDYLSLLNLKLTQGRNFSTRFPSDTVEGGRKAIIINETLAKRIGKQFALNRPIKALGDAVVIGVVKDYHFSTLESKIEPMMLRVDPKSAGQFLLKLRAGATPETVARLGSDWKRVSDGQPFNYTFMDQDIAKQYESYSRWMNIMASATLFAILVACLGLFGLSGLNAANRTKEIGIRKVLGATVSQLFMLLNRETFRLAALAFVLGVPAAWWLMSKWLQDFAYKVDIGWDIFALSGVAGLLTAALAVSFHTVKTALMNPVKSLRTE